MLWSKAIGAGGAGGVVEGWNVSTAVFLQSFSVNAQETAPTGLFFKPDGTKMYVIGQNGDDVNEYNLSTAWNISTAVYAQSKGVASQELQPQGLFFKPDGTSMYIVGWQRDTVYRYTLAVPWDVSTAVFVQSISVNAQEDLPTGLFFKPDGLKMYVIGQTGDDVNEYNLSTAWDVSTAVYAQSKGVAPEDTTPTGLFFKPDGLKMYVIGQTGDDVNEYNLSTAWNISTAVFVQSFSISSKEFDSSAVFFKPDGTKMYIVGPFSNSVHEYDLTA